MTVNTRVLNVPHQHAILILAQADGWSPHRDSPSSGWGHQFVEKIVTLGVRAARADKATIEVDVVSDDAITAPSGVRSNAGIEAVSGIARAIAFNEWLVSGND